MNDPIDRLPVIFGQLLAKLRTQRGHDAATLAAAARLASVNELLAMESGSAEPTLSSFFRIADALGEATPIFFIDLVTAWRADPISDPQHRSRPSDFARLYRVKSVARVPPMLRDVIRQGPGEAVA